MKLGWFGLYCFYQTKKINKRRKVEKTEKSSDLNKDNEKDDYSFKNNTK